MRLPCLVAVCLGLTETSESFSSGSHGRLIGKRDDGSFSKTIFSHRRRGRQTWCCRHFGNGGSTLLLANEAALNLDLVSSTPMKISPPPTTPATKIQRTDSLANVKTDTEKPNQKGRRATKDNIAPNRHQNEGALYWRVDTDHFDADYAHDASGNSRFLSTIAFDIRGNPLPLRRHRTSRGFVYNPSAAAQESFRKIVQEIITDKLWGVEATAQDQVQYPLFESHHVLRMTLVFHLRRPNNHFVAGRRGAGRLRESAPSSLSPTKKDVDNLAKFVLDSLNGIAYADDHQIASLHVTKLLDDRDECLGKARVKLELLSKHELDELAA